MRQSIRSKSEVDAPPSLASSSHSTNDDEINPDHVDNPPPARPTQVRPNVSPPPKISRHATRQTLVVSTTQTTKQRARQKSSTTTRTTLKGGFSDRRE